jgi:hypothetical protein
MKSQEYISEMMGVDEVESLPHFDITSEQLSTVSDWQVGEDYTLTVKVHLTALSENEKGMTACTEVLEVSE